MNKPLYIIVSLSIFLIINPLFNGIFSYILKLFHNYQSRYFSFDYFTLFICVAYITTFIPAAIMGILYGLLSPTRKKTVLLWLIPLLGCIVYLIYAFIFEIFTHIFGVQIIYASYASLVIALLSIGGTFVTTLLSNVVLKGNNWVLFKPDH